MIKQEYIDLMNQEIDGANTPEQSRLLEDFLSGHQEARTYYRELAQSVGVFEKVDMLNPPPGLRDQILSGLDQPAGIFPEAESTPASKGLWAALRGLMQPRLEPAYAFTFIAGLAIGLALFAGSSWLTNRHGTDLYDGVQGTANHRVLNHLGSRLEALDYPGLSGRYRIQREGSDLSLHLELASLKPATVQFRFGPDTVLQHYNSDNPSPTALKAGLSAAELSHEGEGQYDLVFRLGQENLAPVTMSVFSEGGLIHSETLVDTGK